MGSRSRNHGYLDPWNARPQAKVPELSRPPRKMVIRNRQVRANKHRRSKET